MRCSVIEIESDIVSMGVFEKRGSSLYRIYYKDDFIGVINYITDGIITEVGINRLSISINNLAEQASQLKCKKIKLIAKSSLRYLINREQVIKSISELTGLKVEIISGTKENKYLLSSLLKDKRSLKKGVLCDIGGSSTRIIAFEEFDILEEKRISLGSLNAYNMFVGGIIPTLRQEQEIKDYLKCIYKNSPPINTKRTRTIYVTGSCIEAIAILHMGIYGLDLGVNGYSFTVEKLKSARQIITGEIIDLPKLLSVTVPDRITTIIPCIDILTGICEILGSQEIIINTSQIKDSIATELAVNNIQKSKITV